MLLPTALSSRVSNITDVRIGDALGATYLGTAIWREASYLAWHDARDEGIWVCQLDPETGEMNPPDGKGTFIGTAAPFVRSFFLGELLGEGTFGTANGPEWGNSQQGLGIFLTIIDEDGVYQQARCLTGDFTNLNVEQLTFGGDNHRYSNLPTQTASDPVTRVGFLEVPVGQGTSLGQDPEPQATFWQFADPEAAQHPIPLDAFTFNGVRWIPGQPSVTTFVKDDDDTIQVAIYNTETEALDIITSGPEQHAEGEIVADPDTGLPRWLACIEDERAIAVYELIAGEWQKTGVVEPDVPKAGNKPFTIFACKPLLVRGELFFYYNVLIGEEVVDALFSPIDIYLGSADGTVNQPLTDARIFDRRVNAQYYIGTQDNKVFLYYYTSLPLPGIVHLGKFHRLSFEID